MALREIERKLLIFFNDGYPFHMNECVLEACHMNDKEKVKRNDLELQIKCALGHHWYWTTGEKVMIIDEGSS